VVQTPPPPPPPPPPPRFSILGRFRALACVNQALEIAPYHTVSNGDSSLRALRMHDWHAHSKP